MTTPTSQYELPTTGQQDRQVPHSLSAEMSVLGSMLLAKEATGQIIPILTEECFFRPEHRLVFQSLIGLYKDGSPSDPIALRHELKRNGSIKQIGGPEYIAQLMTSVPSAANVEHYAKIVREKYMLRRLIETCSETLHEAFADAMPTGEVLDLAEKRIFDITQDRISGGPEPLTEFLDDTFRQLEEREGDNYITGTATGYTELDDLTSGLQDGELIVIAGRPSMGKTAFGLNVAEHMAIDLKKPVAFFSLEMSKQQVAQRLLCSRSRVDSHRVRRGMLSNEEISKLHMACDVLREAPLFVDDSPGMSILELRAKTRLLKIREDIAVVFVDYLQLLTSPGAEARQQEVGSISRGLKILAREINVPVVALAQLNRGVEGRESHRPRMSDLRESGSIEQEADVIMLLHREDYYRDTGNETSDEAMGTAEIIVAKQRNGPVGTVQLTFLKKLTRFENLSHVSVAEAAGYNPAPSGNSPF